MYYFAIFITLCFFAFCEQSNIDHRHKTVMYSASYLMLMLTAGLRYETGGDWPSYTEIFNRIEPIDRLLAGDNYYFRWMASLEPGYKYLNSIIKFVSGNVQLLFFVVAVIMSTFVFKGIKQYNTYPVLGVVIYFGILFFTLDMIVLRQGLAVSIVFWGYKYVEQHKFWKYLLVCLAAAQFHISALAAILVYIVCRRRYSAWLLITLNMAFIGMFVLQIKWMSGIVLNLLSAQIDPVIAQKLITYTTHGAYAVSRGLTLGFVANIVIFAVLMIRREQLEKHRYFNLFLNLFVLYLFIYFCMSEFVEFGNRIKYYFMISLVVLIPQVVASYKLIRIKMAGFVAACAFAFLYCRGPVLESPSAAAFNPYQNYIVYKIFPYHSDGSERLYKSDREFLKKRE